MQNEIENQSKCIKFYKKCLYIKVNGTETKLGRINTRKGGLTRQQKLQAVSADGDWVEI